MKRIALAVTIVVCGIAVAAFATAGSAQGPTARSLHLVATTQPIVGFSPRHESRPGDRVGAGDIITGDDTGIDRLTCTVIAEDDALCTAVAKLSRGTITAQGLVTLTSDSAPSPTRYAITGGTGDYEGASGTAVVTDIPGTEKANIDITLLP
jgi:hypothetical protein